MKLEKWTGLLKKYRYAALIVLAVVNAVSVLTGLSSDKISVVKWKS